MVKEKKVMLWILIILILALAFFLRLNQLSLANAGHDEVRVFLMSQRMIETGDFIFNGFINAELNETFGPLVFYIYGFGLLFSNHYLTTVMVTALFGSIAVVLCFLFVKKFFGIEVGIITTALFSVNVWHIFFSRIAYGSPMVSPLIILFFMAAYYIYIKNRQWYWVLLFLSFGLAIQIHLSPIVYAPLILFLFLSKIRSLKVKPFIIGIIVFFLLMSPFLYYNVTNEYQGFKDLIVHSRLQEDNTFLINVRDALGIPIVIGTNYMGKYILGNTIIFTRTVDKLFSLIGIGMGIFLIFSIAITAYNTFIVQFLGKMPRIRIKNKEYLLLLLWLLLPIFFLILRDKNIQPRYLLITMPVQFIMISIGLRWVYKKFTNRKLMKKLVYGMVGVYVILMSVLWIGMLNVVDEYGGSDGTYTPPFKTKIEVVQYILSQERNPTIVWYKERDMRYDYFFKNYEASPIMIKLESIEEVKKQNKGFMIIDEKSREGILFKRTLISNEEIMFLEKLNGERIGFLKVVKLPQAVK